MDKETLEKAKSLEGDIEQMKAAIALYRKGDRLGADDDYFHFEYCKGSGGLFTEREELPARLNQRLMAMVEEELHRTEAELVNLGSWEPSAAGLPRVHGDWQRLRTYTEGDTVMGEDGVEYVYRNGRFVKASRRLWPGFWYKSIPFIILILDISAMSIVCARYWEIVSQFFAGLIILNLAGVFGITVALMIGIKKGRDANHRFHRFKTTTTWKK